jgi:putative flippase GtrA
MTTDTPSPAPAESSFVQGAITAIKGKGLKYSMVSVVNVVVGQGLLLVFVHAGVTAWLANAVAVIISAIPAYYMSRAWVWGKRGKSELKREILPFWIFVGIGLFLSTGFVAIAAVIWPVPPDAGFFNLHKLIPNIVSILAFGVLWVIRFFWMDSAFHLEHDHGFGLDVLLDPNEPV